MKKLVSLILAVAMSLTMVACSGGDSKEKDGETSEAKSKVEESSDEDKKIEPNIALVTDVGTINDKSFNQGSWEGVLQYAEENSVEHKYYQPQDKSKESITSTIELAIKGGANTVVCPGFLFEEPLYNVQDKYPDVKFIIIDGVPNDGNKENKTTKVSENTTSIFFAEEQAGFLAGYGAVMEGYRNLGFMGGIKLPAVVRYGYGFIEGAEYAGKELGLSKDDIKINYTYVGNFDASPEHTVKASSWFNEGTEIIFACGGGVGNSVMKAASTAGKKVIGVDVDQSGESDTVITSAMKNLQGAVYNSLVSIYDGTFIGGETRTLDTKDGSVLLPMETSTFEKFTQEQYDTIYEKISSGEIEISKDTDAAEATDLKLDIASVVLK